MQTLGNAVSSAKNLIGNGPGRLLISSAFYSIHIIIGRDEMSDKKKYF